jgi:glucose/arabinose dehydrogenase
VSDPRGSILRVSGAPDGNTPWSWQVVARGVRNSQALVRLPSRQEIVFLDHGPSGAPDELGRTGLDEINLLTADGLDFGWPSVAGHPDDEATVPPLHVWQEAVAPAGVAVLPGARDAETTDLLVTTLRARSLRVVRLRSGPDGGGVLCESSLLDSLSSRLRALAVRTESSEAFVGTSNRDGRGWPSPGDDHLLRIRLATPHGAEHAAAQPDVEHLLQAQP